mgnify:CR=1 FL=1
MPIFLKRCATEPLVPRLPLYFVRACLTSDTVLFLLSVRHSIITAIPLGPYPSYVISSNESLFCPEPFFIALSIVSLGTLFLLALGAILTGYIFKETLIGNYSKEFWLSSIFFLEEIKHINIPVWFLVLTPTLVIISIPLSFYYFVFNTNILKSFKKTNLPLYNFLLNKWYVDELYENIFVMILLKVCIIRSRNCWNIAFIEPIE